jgi:ankyrin repeat protein
MQAADEGNAASIKILLENGVDREVRNLAHESALSIALRRGHADIVQLLKKSAPPTKRHAVN